MKVAQPEAITLGLAKVYFSKEDAPIQADGDLPPASILREECHRRVSRFEGMIESLDPGELCNRAFTCARIVRGLEGPALRRVLAGTSGKGVVFHRGAYLIENRYMHGMRSLRIWIPALIQGSMSDVLRIWLTVAPRMRDLIEGMLRRRGVTGETSRYFAEVHILYSTNLSPIDVKINPELQLGALGLDLDWITSAITPLKSSPPASLERPAEVPFHPVLYMSRDGLLVPWLRWRERSRKGFHAFARRIRRNMEHAVDLALGLDLFLRLDLSSPLLYEWEPFCIGLVGLSPYVIRELSRGKEQLRYLAGIHFRLTDVLDIRDDYEDFREKVAVPPSSIVDMNAVTEMLRHLGLPPVPEPPVLLRTEARLVLLFLVLKGIADRLIHPKNDPGNWFFFCKEAVRRLAGDRFSRGEAQSELEKRCLDFKDQISCRHPQDYDGLTRREIEALILAYESAIGRKVDARLRNKVRDSLIRGGEGNALRYLEKRDLIIRGRGRLIRGGKCGSGDPEVRVYLPNRENEFIKWNERLFDDFRGLLSRKFS